MVKDENKKVLVQERIGSNWSGIAFPGGHVEAGESFVQSVVREVFEEAGYTIENPQLCGIKQFPTDPVALDQACIDLVYSAEDSASLVQRIESRNGLHVLDFWNSAGFCYISFCQYSHKGLCKYLDFVFEKCYTNTIEDLRFTFK